MADVKKLAPIISKWEGGFVNDKMDRGGATNMGITLETWKSVGYDKDRDGDIDANDVRLLTRDDFYPVLKQYWNRWQGDNIKNQSIANILVDWVWGSGKWGIVKVQQLLDLKDDGIVGTKTLQAVNFANQKELFDRIFEARKQFLQNIVKNDPTQGKFIKGWLNRLNDFKFKE